MTLPLTLLKTGWRLLNYQLQQRIVLLQFFCNFIQVTIQWLERHWLAIFILSALTQAPPTTKGTRNDAAVKPRSNLLAILTVFLCLMLFNLFWNERWWLKSCVVVIDIIYSINMNLHSLDFGSSVAVKITFFPDIPLINRIKGTLFIIQFEESNLTKG